MVIIIRIEREGGIDCIDAGVIRRHPVGQIHGNPLCTAESARILCYIFFDVPGNPLGSRFRGSTAENLAIAYPKCVKAIILYALYAPGPIEDDLRPIPLG